MTSPQKEKGARAEREVAAMLCDLLGVHCRRQLGAGRLDDVGDIDLVLHGQRIVVQVADYTDPMRAVRDKLHAVDVQVANARAQLGALFVRRRGGNYMVVMSPEMFATWAREATC